MAGQADSLNVAMATIITLFEPYGRELVE